MSVRCAYGTCHRPAEILMRNGPVSNELPICMDHADEVMHTLSLVQPEGRPAYLAWRAEMAARGAPLPEVRTP